MTAPTLQHVLANVPVHMTGEIGGGGGGHTLRPLTCQILALLREARNDP